MGKYVYRKLLETDEIVNWAKEQGLSHMLDPDDLHATIVYSKSDFTKAPDSNTVKIKGGSRNIKKYPSTYGNKKALVLEFSCPLIEQQHKAYLAAGATSEYPTFLLQMTLTYKGSKVDISNIEPYKGPLFFSEEYQEPLIDEPWEFKEVDLAIVETVKVGDRKLILKLAGNVVDSSVAYECHLIEFGKDNDMTKNLLEQQIQAKLDFEEAKLTYIAYESKVKK